MTDAERERAAIVEWLQDNPFPWLDRDASRWERAQAAWAIFRGGAEPIRGLLGIVALKIERLDHHKEDSKHG
jgi:hypothetical protein